MEFYVLFYNLNDGYNYVYWVFRMLLNLVFGLFFYVKIYLIGMVCYWFFGILVLLKILYIFKENYLF